MCIPPSVAVKEHLLQLIDSEVGNHDVDVSLHILQAGTYLVQYDDRMTADLTILANQVGVQEITSSLVKKHIFSEYLHNDRYTSEAM